MLMFAGFVSAQQKKKVAVKKVAAKTVSTEDHLCFMGVPIDGSMISFVNKLSAKGIKIPPTLDDHYIKINGEKAFIKLNNENGLCMVDLYTHYFPENSDKYNHYFNLTCKDIEKKYKYKKYYYRDLYYNFDPESDVQTVYTIYSSKNPSKKIGDIIIQTVWGNGLVCALIKFCDYQNCLKYFNNYPYYNSEIDWNNNMYSTQNFSIKYGIEKNTGNVFIKHFILNKIYNYVLTGEDKHIFCNLMFACNDENTRNFFLTKFFNYASKEVENINETYIIEDYLENIIKNYYTSIEEKKKERERQLAQRRKSYGFMDLMHMLAPGFFTQDDVELWNKLPESDQRAVINGTFGAYFGMGDTRGHTEKMHTPSLRNQQ